MNSVDPDVSFDAENVADEGSENGLPFSRLTRWMVLAEQMLAALFLFLILAAIGTQVFARYFFGTPFSWSEEVARFALIWMTFMAASFVMAEGRHITVDLLSARLSARGKLWLECFSHAVVAATCLLLLIGGGRFVWYVSKVGSPSLGIPMSWWYGAVSFGLLLMAIHSIVNLLQNVAAGRPIGIDNAQGGAVNQEAFHLKMEQGE